mgnify:CR=1 FL=1
MKNLSNFIKINEASNDKFVMGLASLIDTINKPQAAKGFSNEIKDLVKSVELTGKDIYNFSSLLQKGKFNSRMLSKKGALGQASSMYIDVADAKESINKAGVLEKLHILFLEEIGEGYWKGW